MYSIRTLQEFEDYLDERCLRDGESFTLPCIKAWNEKQRQRGYSGFSDDADKAILLAAGGAGSSGISERNCMSMAPIPSAAIT